MSDAAKPPEMFDDNPEWTEMDFAAARSVHEMHSAAVASVLIRSDAKRADGSSTKRGSLRHAAFAQGPGARRSLLAA